MADNFNISDQPGGGGAGVDSFNGRTGVVVAAASDYDASQIDNDSLVAGSAVSGALNTLFFGTVANFTANDAVFVGASAATGIGRNGHSLIAFDDTTNEEIQFEGIIDRVYNPSRSIIVDIHWAAATATTGNVKWDAQLENLAEAGQDLDLDGFPIGVTGTQGTNATAGVLTYTGLTMSNAEADSIVAGNSFRLKITRDAANVLDTMVGDAQILGVEIRQI